MITRFELRRLIECGFQPLSCSCTVDPDGSLMINIVDPITGCVELLVTGVSSASLVSSQAIASLIDELSSEMVARKIAFA